MWGGMEGNNLAEYTFNPLSGPNGTLSFTTSYVISGGPSVIREKHWQNRGGPFFTPWHRL